MVDNRCNLHRVLTLEMKNMQMLHAEPGNAARRHSRMASPMPGLAQNAELGVWAACAGIEPLKTMVKEFGTEAMKAS